MWQVMFYTLAVVTFGTAVPAGQFVPGIMIGSTYGRLVGMFVVKYYRKLHIEEGTWVCCLFTFLHIIYMLVGLFIESIVYLTINPLYYFRCNAWIACCLCPLLFVSDVSKEGYTLFEDLADKRNSNTYINPAIISHELGKLFPLGLLGGGGGYYSIILFDFLYFLCFSLCCLIGWTKMTEMGNLCMWNEDCYYKKRISI